MSIYVGNLPFKMSEDDLKQLFANYGEVTSVKIIIDKKSLVYLDGTELDYVKEGLNEGFEFTNPNERDRCGCGESFRV